MVQLKNRRALHEYFVIQKFEAGIALMAARSRASAPER